MCNNTVCANGGECVEGPGLTFGCHCTEGWAGALCEADVDECARTPCQHGGLCINTPGSYTCACLFGESFSPCDTPCD